MKRTASSATLAALLVAGLGWPGIAAAGKASVVKVKANSSGGGYYFTVTVAHADTGWDHYANKFEILSPDDKVLGTRVLFHPHVDEQPFTRGSSVISIPPGITSVIVRAWDSVHKAGDKTFTVKLPGR
ncbi:MAG TPA: hypothetical protein QGH84_11840 [Rhodospirillales bacterium]|jgi:hypothetical protein|nr:hypothetical protein [Rhodospirillales bacterium]